MLLRCARHLSLASSLLLVSGPAAAAEFSKATGHWYEFVSANVTWTQAEAAAASTVTFNGQPAYLVTITSPAENAFLIDKFGTGFAQSAWIGANDVAVEEEWRWVAGPEAGTQFWQGDQTGSTTPPFNYANWGSSEPNDFLGEDYAVIALGNLAATIPQGTWGDANNVGTNASVVGYIVEFDALAVPALTPWGLTLLVLAIASASCLAASRA